MVAAVDVKRLAGDEARGVVGEEGGGNAHIVDAHKTDAPMREAMAIKRARLEAKRVRRPGVQPSGGPSKTACSISDKE